MLIVMNSKGRNAPVVVCDKCGDRIKSAKDGMVLYPSSGEEGKPVAHYHVHRGECDKAMTKKHGDLGGTDELATHLVWLLSNLELNGEQLKKATINAGLLESL